MNRIDRYIATNVGLGFLVALGALLSIFSVINLADELHDVGVGGYTSALAFWYVLMTLPSEAYELFGAAALVGSAAGLALMVSNNELVAIFAAGISPGRVIAAVLKTATGLALTAALLGEFVAAPLAEQATATRSVALSRGQSLSTARGIWAREGSRFVNIRRPVGDDGMADLYIYDFDEESQLQRVTHAGRATFTDGRWELSDVEEDILSDTGVVRKNLERSDWETVLTPEQLYLLTLPPEQLSLGDLRSSVASMQDRGESAQHHLLAFWHRVLMPVVAAIMVFLAVPVILSMPQRVPFGYRIALAALLGIGFQMLDQTFGSFGLVYGLNPFLSATIPTMIALGLGLWRLRLAF